MLDWAFLRRLARSPRVALGEGFQAGEWRTPDLVGLLELLADNYTPIAGEGPLAALSRLRGLVPRPRLRHGLRASEQDVQAHYDLSNEFFALWLDPSLTYSCAVFEEPDSRSRRRSSTSTACCATASGSRPTTTCSRSAPAGGEWPCTRRASAAAASPPPRSPARSTSSRRGASPRPGSPTAWTCSSSTTAGSPDATTASCRSRCSRRSATSSCRRTSARSTACSARRRGRDPDDHDPRAALPLVSPVGGLAATPHLPRRPAPVGRRDRPRVRSRDPPRRVPARRDRPPLRADARPLARAVPRARRRGARARVRRALLPHVGVLSRLLRGGVREPRDPRRAAGARAAVRARGTDRV